MIMFARKLFRSSALRASLLYGLNGLGFSLGSLLLARAMVPTEFAWIALCTSIAQIAGGLGHLGASTLVVRHIVNPDGPFLARIVTTSLVCAVVLAMVSVTTYGMPVSLAAILLVYCFFFSVNKVSAGFLRGRQKFVTALFLGQIQGPTLLVAGGIALLWNTETAAAICSVLVISVAIASMIGWSLSFSAERRQDAVATASLPWTEGLSFVAIDTAMITFVALERLVIPKTLDLELLATFAVLSAVVGSPFRILQQGVGFTLTPRLRAATSTAERRELVFEEFITVIFVLAISSVLIWLFTPWLVTLILADKYTLTPALIAAGMLSGFGKVIGAIATSVITAVGDAAALHWLNLLSWISLAIGVGAAFVGARWGLTGVVLGVGIAWVINAAITFFLAAPHFLERKRNQESGTGSSR